MKIGGERKGGINMRPPEQKRRVDFSLRGGAVQIKK